FACWGVISIEAGLISPPIGMNLNIIKGVASDVPMSTVFRGVMPFFCALLVLMALVLFIPQIALYLPSVLR
ncbi:MAG TPA: C4-dicarboxylate ABC transporter permease, partial [Firmicutes bacterium]|nr:C4-dicarboxylate ABC transporter permease [Bacillota bacterium]